MQKLLLTIVVGIIFMIPAAHAQPILTRVDYQTVLYPRSIAAGDFDKDGDLDLITVQHGLNKQQMAYHANNGNATFAPPVYRTVNLTSFGYPAFAIFADFNNDAKLDIAVSNNAGISNLTIFYGLGDGTFTDSTSYLWNVGVFKLIACDVNNDGWTDVVLLNGGGNSTISVCLNAQDGTLLPPMKTNAGNHVANLISADLNGDGNEDVVVIGWQDACFRVLLGKGDGTFWPYTQYDTPNWTYGIAIANLVGDASLDVAVTVTDYQNSTGDTTRGVWVYRGIGDGTLALQATIPTAANPMGLATANLMGSSALDLVVACADSNVIQVIGNNGDGTFGTPTSYPTAIEPIEIVAADFDHNGKVDVAVTNRGTDVFCVFRNESPTVCVDADHDGFGDPGHPENTCPTDNCPSIYNPDQADWNNDGVGDACTPTDTGTNVTVQPDQNTSITFDAVAQGGTTGVISTYNGPNPPANFGVVPLGQPQYLNISSTAEFSGLITICVDYADSNLVGPEDSVQLLHFENGGWTDITTSRDTVANTICGVTTSLSPFALVEHCCSGMLGNVDCSHDGRIDISDLTRLIDYLYISFTPLCCSAGANVDGSPDNNIDISDLSALVDYLYISFTPPTTCQ